MEEFYLLPDKDKLYKFDSIAVNVIVNNSKGWFKTTLPISFQFHHAQMDGGHGAMFMKLLQRGINRVL